MVPGLIGTYIVPSVCVPPFHSLLGLLGLLHLYHIIWPSHCNLFEDWVPVDFIYGYPIFKWIAVSWYGWYGYQNSSLNNEYQATCPNGICHISFCGMKFRLWWRHQMETFSALLAICVGNSPVPSEFPHKGQWRGALMFSLICAWINRWVNNREGGDLRRHRTHYDVIVMILSFVFVRSHQQVSILLRVPFHGRFIVRDLNSMENWFSCNSISGYNITTKFYTCHNSIAVMPCAEFHNDHLTTTWISVECNLHGIWIMMKKLFMKWAAGRRGLTHRTHVDFFVVIGSRKDFTFWNTIMILRYF